MIQKLKILSGMMVMLILSYLNIQAQELLTLDKAIKTGLENNYSIRLVKNNATISENNLTLGNAGFLPTVDISASGERDLNDVKQTNRDGTVTKPTNNYNYQSAGIALNWTIFDGMDMFVSLSRLKELKELGEINVKNIIENNVAQIINSYYDIVRLEQMYIVFKDEIVISEQRVKIAQDKFDLGGGSKLELLQAKVDLNADKSSLLKQETSIAKAKFALNQLLGRDIKAEFSVDTAIVTKSGLSYETLYEKALSRNKSLMLAQKDADIASLNLSSQKAQLYPKVSAYADYLYSNSNFDSGALRSSRDNEIFYGLKLSFNIFNGLNDSRQIENARVSLISSGLQLEDLKNRIKVDFERGYKDYIDNLQIMKMEEENLQTARQTVDVAVDRLKYGTYSPLELRIAQKTLEEAHSRLIEAKYNAKQSETELLRISGDILTVD